MKLLLNLIILLFLANCSASYKELTNNKYSSNISFNQTLIEEYKSYADYEAKEMHDWNSAKLYSEKALKSLETNEIYPEKITYWKLSSKKAQDIKSGYNNLLSIYDEAYIKDPKNLAKAISSLDCWAEQEEEKWQAWDIEKCKNDFHTSMHNIYKFLTNLNKKEDVRKKSTPQVAVVTENEKKEVMQIIYFDFDNSKLSQTSINTLINFLNKNKKELNRYIIYGHTDTKGAIKYNMNLSIKRAVAVKEILLNQGVPSKDISLLGKGENELAINTPDNTKHPANRRAEIKILN